MRNFSLYNYSKYIIINIYLKTRTHNHHGRLNLLHIEQQRSEAVTQYSGGNVGGDESSYIVWV